MKIQAMILAALAAGGLMAGDGAEAFAPDRVRLLDGPFKEIQELHRTGLVGQLEPDRLLFPFRRNAGLPQPQGVTGGYGGWDDAFIQGHYAGHYLSAASRMYAATGDAAFRDKACYMVDVLAACQQKLGGGYLSAFPEARLARLEANPHKGLVEYYTLHKVLAGLVDTAKTCGSTQALAVASGLSDYVAGRMARLTSEQIELLLRTDYTGNPVNEFGGMGEALADLARLARQSGDPRAERHLRLSALFGRDWFVAPLLAGEDRLGGLHGNTHIAHACGLARYALAANDDRAFRSADAFFRLVSGPHAFVNGGNAFNEKLRAAGTEVAGKGDAALSPLTAEFCNTYNMLKLARSLFEHAPSTAYGDYCEAALFNHVLAGIAPDHGKVTYHLPLRPGDYRVHIDEPFCCQGSGLEHAARFGEAIWFGRGDALWVNLYIASTLDWREQGLKLRLDTRYPDDGTVRLAVDEAVAPVKAAVHLRLPGWLDETPTLLVNGAPAVVEARPGSFLTLTRVWNRGDVVALRLPLKLRVRPSLDDPATVSFFHGPVLLAGRLGRAGMPESDIGGHVSNKDAPAFPVPVLVAPAGTSPETLLSPVADRPLNFTARMVGVADRQPVEIALAPFHRVQHERYAVYWKTMTPEAFDGYAAARRKELGAQGVAFIGDPEAEKSRALLGERTRSGRFGGRGWRDAADGGWFSYRLEIGAAQDTKLVCTYWGGEETERVFDIFVDDAKIATQTLKRNKPGEFFDVAYPVPADAVHGKQFAVVRFQAHPGSTAGGVFGVRFAAGK